MQNVALSGFADLEAKLKELPGNVARAATRRGMVRGGNLMAEEQRQRAPGSLAGTIVVKARARNLTGLADFGDVMAGGGSFRDAQSALRAARRSGGSEGTRMTIVVGSTAPHARLVERGTVARFHKSGKSTGTMPMQPFVRPAWDAKWREMLTAVRDEIVVEVRKSTARIARRAARAGGV